MSETEEESRKDDFCFEKNATESLISHTLDKWYQAKHPAFSPSEIYLVNTLKPETCPYCGSEKIIRKGFQKSTGFRRWKCNSCGRRFSPLTGTIFDSRKIPISEWIEYLLHLFEYHSVSSAARDNRNAESTGFYWLQKVFLVLKDYQDDIVLKGDVYIDETYVSVWQSRKIRKNGKQLRGLSKNQCCVCTGTELQKSFFILCGKGNPSSKKVWKAYSPHIEKGSTIIHDGDPSHNILIEKLSLKSEVHPSNESKNRQGSSNPLDRINKLHGSLKKFLRIHDGFDTDYLQDWLNLFCFIRNEGYDDTDRLMAFFRRALKTRRVLRYSTWADPEKDDVH